MQNRFPTRISRFITTIFPIFPFVIPVWSYHQTVFFCADVLSGLRVDLSLDHCSGSGACDFRPDSGVMLAGRFVVSEHRVLPSDENGREIKVQTVVHHRQPSQLKEVNSQCFL